MSKFYTKREKKFYAGQVIFSENNDCDGMYYITRGMVRIFKRIETVDGQRELELVQLGPKSLFGEMAIIDNKKRSATAQAVEETSCLIMSRYMIQQELKKLPSWVTNLFQVLVTRLRETNETLREKTKMIHDDTGSIVYVSGDLDQTDASRMKYKLEETIDMARRSLKQIDKQAKNIGVRRTKAAKNADHVWTPVSAIRDRD